MSRLPKISYSIPEAAAATGTTEKAIRLAIKEHALPARRQPYPDGTPRPPGLGKYLIRHDDLVAWVEDMQESA